MARLSHTYKIARLHIKEKLNLILGRPPFAPGEWNANEAEFANNQRMLLELCRIHGPIFRVWLGGKHTTCIVGHELGRQFLSKNRSALRAATTDLTPIFPHGFLRGMEGNAHREYRKLIGDAMRKVSITSHRGSIQKIIFGNLDELAQSRLQVTGKNLAKTLHKCATSCLSLLVYGIASDSRIADEIEAAHNAYAPNGIHAAIRPEHHAPYSHLKNAVLKPSSTDRVANSVWTILGDQSEDETVLGNLVHLVELGRYDLHGLWRWIFHFLASNPEVSARLRDTKDKAARKLFVSAIVSETLRLQQSELIYRVATSDITFSGFLIPAKSRVRICIWEGHRDPDAFKSPNEFRPERFLSTKFDHKTFAPLGLDHHSCLGDAWIYALSSELIFALIDNYEPALIRSGASTLGRAHFEPGPEATYEIRKLKPGA